MRLFAQLSWYFRREWRRYLGAVALLVIIAMLQLVPPKVVGIVVDGVTEQHFTTGQILMWIATMGADCRCGLSPALRLAGIAVWCVLSTGC